MNTRIDMDEHVKELLTRTNTVSKHELVTQTKNNKEVQKRRLGLFQSELKLPFRNGVIDMLLSGLMEEDKQFEPIWREKGSALVPVLYIGPSGVGKTHQLFQHAIRGFICYFTAGDNLHERDHCLRACYNKLTKIESSKPEVDNQKQDKSQTQEDERKLQVNEYRQLAAEKCLCVLSLSKLIALRHLSDTSKGFSPKMFIVSQLNGSSEYYAEVFEMCYEYCEKLDYDTVVGIHKMVIKSLSKDGFKVGICFDEAQMFRREYPKLFFASKTETRNPYTDPRDLLYAITGLVCVFPGYDYAAFAGTQLRLADAKEYIQSYSGRMLSINLFNRFPFIKDADEAMAALRKTLNIGKRIKIPTHITRKLFGRIRTLALVTQMMMYDDKKTKQQNLIDAINAAFDSNFEIILNRFRRTEKSLQQSKVVMDCLTTMLLTTHFEKSSTFHAQSLPDFVHAGICHLDWVDNPGGVGDKEFFFLLNEPLGVALASGILEFLRLSGVKPRNKVVQQAIEHVGQLIRNKSRDYQNENLL